MIDFEFYNAAMGPKDAAVKANSVDPNQTAPSSLIRVYTVCIYISVLVLRIFTADCKTQ